MIFFDVVAFFSLQLPMRSTIFVAHKKYRMHSPNKNLVIHRITSLMSTLLVSGTLLAQTGSWTALTNTAPNANSGVMLLLTDGTVICKTSTGGSAGYGTTWNRLTPVNGSYLNGTWTTIAPMARERLYFSSQVLPDGRVYVCGGEYGAGGSYGEVYNPATNTWIGAGGGTAFPNVVSDANSEILPNGDVLQACVDETGSALNYFWNPATNTYTAAPSCLRIDNEAVWVKLPDSSILFMDNYSTTSERYIPQTNTWINDATAPANVFDPYGSESGSGFLLPDGRVFFIGSTPVTLYYTPSGSTAPGTWALGPAIPGSYGASDAAAAMMPNGNILTALSPTPTAANHFPSPTKYYEFSYLTNSFTQVGAPGGGTTTANACYISNMLVLPDGAVLFANQGDNQYYEYVPGTGPLPAGQPTIGTVTRLNCDTFRVTGTLFNGIGEGAAYGDDWQMSTNYPIVRLSNGTNTYYATTYNWNRIGAVMTGALPDTAIFKLPAAMPAGVYSVSVVANGNPSAPYRINTSLTIAPTPITLCPGSATTLSDSATIGKWSSGNTGVATVDSLTGIVTGVAAGTTNISYSIGACFAIDPVTVTTLAPSLPVVTPPATTPCAGAASATYTATATSAAAFNWSVTGTGWSGTSTTGTFNVAVGTGPGQIVVYATNACGTGPSDTINVTPSAQPAVPTISLFGPAPCLTSTSAQYIGSATGATALTWTVLGTGWTGVTSLDTETVTLGTGTGTVICSGTNACGSGPADTITITPASGVGAASPILATGPMCLGGTVTFVTSGITGATSYVWTVSGIGWVGSSTTTLLTCTVGSGPLTISVYGEGTCGAGASYTLDSVFAVVPPTSTFTIANHVIATGTNDLVTYTGTASASGTYTWNFGGGAATPGVGVGPHLVSWGTTGLKTISLSVTDTGCASLAVYTDTVLVVVPTGIQSLVEQDGPVVIYPNPSNGTFNVYFDSDIEHPVTVKLADMQGNVVYTRSFGQVLGGHISIDVPNLPNAVYMATIVTDDFVINRKLTVIR